MNPTTSQGAVFLHIFSKPWRRSTVFVIAFGDIATQGYALLVF